MTKAPLLLKPFWYLKYLYFILVLYDAPFNMILLIFEYYFTFSDDEY